MIETTIVGDREVLVNIDTTVKLYLQAMRDGVSKAGYRNEALTKKFLSGPVLKRRSGRLSAGVHTNVENTDTKSSAVTGIGEDLFYGKIHEQGGTFTVKEHMRMQSKAWGRPMKNPREVSVKAHPATFPQRSFLGRSSRENEAANVQGLREEIAKVKQP